MFLHFTTLKDKWTISNGTLGRSLLTTEMWVSSAAGLGDFLKFFATNATLKLVQIFGNFLGDFEVNHF